MDRQPERPGSWTLVTTLSDPNQRYFGGTVQLRGERNLYVVDGGAVNLYSRSAGVWTRRATFIAADGLFPDPFSEEAMDSQDRWLAAVFSGRGYIFDAAAVLVR